MAITTVSLTPYLIAIDYSQSLSQMITAGKYDHVHSNITQANFPISGAGVLQEEALLVHFDSELANNEVTNELEVMSVEDLPIEHLLAIGAQYPDLQREFSIIARRSVWIFEERLRIIPYLSLSLRKRKLGIGAIPDKWSISSHFLVRRKK